MLEEERKRCLAFLQQQQAAIQAACERTAQRCAALQAAGMAVPECNSFGARQPASHAARQQEQRYSNGLAVLLAERLKKVTVQLAVAREAFSSPHAVVPEACDSDDEDEEYSAM